MKFINWIESVIHRERRWKIADQRGWACLGMALRSRDEQAIKHWIRKSDFYYRITRA